MNSLIVLSVFLSLFQISFPETISYNTWMVDFSVDIVFAADLLFRLASWPTLSNFFLNIYNIIDMSVLPSLIIRAANGIELNVNDGVWSLLLVCFFPVLRLLKLLRRVQTFQVLLSAWWAVVEALPMLIYVLTIIAMTFASLLFVFEPKSNIPDWPTALWLTVVSMTGRTFERFGQNGHSLRVRTYKFIRTPPWILHEPPTAIQSRIGRGYHSKDRFLLQTDANTEWDLVIHKHHEDAAIQVGGSKAMNILPPWILCMTPFHCDSWIYSLFP